MIQQTQGWAVVTGACSGIGKAYAQRLAKAGLKVLMVSENADRLALAIRPIEGSAQALCLDLAQPGAGEQLLQNTQAKDVRVLVSNASFGMGGRLWEQDGKRLNAMTQLNVGTYLTLIHGFMRRFVEADQGTLIIVSSVNVSSPVPQAAAYTATKAFEYYLGAALWEEARHTGVKVQVVLPGPTRTNFQAVAGTQVARVAISPEELVDLAMPHLGRGPVFVPKFRNRFLFLFSGLFPVQKRIRMAGQYYQRLLHQTPHVGMWQLFWQALRGRKPAHP